MMIECDHICIVGKLCMTMRLHRIKMRVKYFEMEYIEQMGAAVILLPYIREELGLCMYLGLNRGYPT